MLENRWKIHQFYQKPGICEDSGEEQIHSDQHMVKRKNRHDIQVQIPRSFISRPNPVIGQSGGECHDRPDFNPRDCNEKPPGFGPFGDAVNSLNLVVLDDTKSSKADHVVADSQEMKWVIFGEDRVGAEGPPGGAQSEVKARGGRFENGSAVGRHSKGINTDILRLLTDGIVIIRARPQITLSLA